ncbi:unnamed protein product [Cladocopium goreaui]|uniref:Uncharacterized protein n=1 Tax=Cladocopium goreaui TaxID=2562237 RepID=A0A9P1BRD5_9DINO|nr:unnamed protein product [Cladocopium goreaui]
MVTTFGSALVHKSPWDSRFLLYCTDNSKSCSNTYDTLDTWVAWSFTELGAGRWLQHSPWGEYMGRREDKAGTLIADGWIGVLVAHRGDEKALAKAFHVKNTWVSEEVCFTCRASRLSDSRYLYTGFGQNAPHRETIVDLHTFVTSKVGPNAWTRVPGFHPSMIAYDWLHVLDLALIPDAAASPGPGIDDRLRAAYVEFSNLCKQHKIRTWVARSGVYQCLCNERCCESTPRAFVDFIEPAEVGDEQLSLPQCVGKVKSLASRSHPRLLGRQVLERYSSFVAVRWLRQLEEG